MKQLVILSVLLGILLNSFSQIGGNAAYSNGYYPDSQVDLSLQNNQWSFSNILEANVMINAKASAYVAIFSVTQHGATIEEAERLLQTRLEAFRKLLLQHNVNREQVFVDPVSLVPAYEVEVENKKFSKTFNEVPSGFEIKKNVHITFYEHDQINRLIAIAAQAEIYDLVKTDYVVSNMDTILDQLRREAMDILLRKKEALIKTGIHLRLNQAGEKYGSVYPSERYAQYYAYKTGVAPSFTVSYKKGQPQQQVQYNYAEKNKTIYYEKVSDKQFDKVINPVVGEPQVQVYLSLKAAYVIYDPETEAADKAYREKMKQLQLEEKELDLELKRKELRKRK